MTGKLIVVLGLICGLGMRLSANEEPPAKPLVYPVQVSEGITVVGAQFGLFKMKRDGSVESFTPAEEVPLITGQRYGWYLDVKVQEQGVTLIDTLTMSAPPRTWMGTGGAGLEISDAGQTAIAELEIPVERGRVFAGKVAKPWFFTDGDPLGEYTLEARIHGEVVFQKTFKVVPANAR